eukprot:CAMPEP_0202031896 /NCGR_PEP_ID=MMETSP0905-20130828/65251_1 /ASSEMBLY_ACC=CAM_ASM_000554 /TAXON_ID=420261 /ORGANISM="Thalassiosira antarctica, Strain CCMP982" /LENGTH=442 /DNA_ID=CAMNT_0048595745 /DNA_START=118 /DNA_END=1446 /DNA_ORIENTATION=-
MSATSTSNLPTNVQSLISQAKDLFEESFGKDDRTNLPIYCASAPGRVNLIGEHTDYTGGYVLPLAIGYNTVCYGRGSIVKSDPTPKKSRIVSTNKSLVEFNVSPSLSPSSTNKWANYVQGVILQYLPDLQTDETFVLDMAIAGDVPLGSGLSSSASLEVATAVFLESIMEPHGVAYSSYKQSHDDASMSLKEVKMERAVRCQRAENVFCNVPCGIMDQFVSSAGCQGKLLLIDCQSLDFQEVSVGGSSESTEELETPVLVVANSNVTHDLGAGEYPIRVRQCKEATEILSKVNPRIQSLRDALMDDISAAESSAGLEGVLLQRARHVVSENKRTVETADALEKGDWKVVGQLMNDSHSSMKNDYEVSCDEIDVLVDLAQNFDGVYGSRLTGGGFGGCTVTLVKKESSQGLIDHLIEDYKKKTGKICFCFETSPGDGAQAISV